VNPADVAAFKTALGHNRASDSCGTSGALPCASFDIDHADTGSVQNIGAPDTAQLRLSIGHPPKPKCPSCPLACQAGADGSCN